MVHLWRMHRFAREVRNQWRIMNDDIGLDEYKDPTLKKIKQEFKKKKRMWRYPFMDGEVNEIIFDMAIGKNRFCNLTTSTDKKPIKTLHLNESGKELSSFSGYIEELFKRRRRGGIALTSFITAVTLFVLNKLF